MLFALFIRCVSVTILELFVGVNSIHNIIIQKVHPLEPRINQEDLLIPGTLPILISNTLNLLLSSLALVA